jgi:hypothetical protein
VKQFRNFLNSASAEVFQFNHPGFPLIDRLEFPESLVERDEIGRRGRCANDRIVECNIELAIDRPILVAKAGIDESSSSGPFGSATTRSASSRCPARSRVPEQAKGLRLKCASAAARSVVHQPMSQASAQSTAKPGRPT